MRYRLLIAALITGCLIFPRIEASGGEYDSADCLTLSNFRFDKYGYDLGLSSYLSNEEKSNKSPGLAISISWGTIKCESDLSKLNVAQFDVQLSISNYSRSELLPETTKRILSYELATYEYYFRLPAIKPGKYYVEVLVRDLTYSRSPFFNLLEEYDFSVEAPKIGGACTKVNQFHESKSTVLVCATAKGKKTWRNATSVEKSLYLKEKSRLAKANADARAAADKVAADKAVADAAAKAAADKAVADAAAKATADKAVADAIAKAAADKAAAEAAARAADVPGVIAGRFFSGPDADDSSWKWVAVEIRNSSPYNILSHRSYDVLIGDAGGAIVNSSWEPGFPLLLPGQSAWYVTTQFNSANSSQAVFRKTYSTQPSPLSASEFPSTLSPRLVTSPYYANRKAVGFTLKNNSSSMILGSSSKAFAVVFNSAGVPVYAVSGFIGKSLLPGGQAEITVGDFTFNGEYSYILVTIGVNVS